MEKAKVFYNSETVKCVNCGKDLFKDTSLSMVQFVTNNKDMITRVVPCCKGECDKRLRRLLNRDEIDGWRDFGDFINPYIFLKHIMSVMNCMYEDKGFENKEAFENYKNLVIRCYPYVSRNMTEKEIESARIDEMIPF